MKRVTALALSLGLFALTASLPAAPSEDQKAVKEKLRDLSDFIGGWNGSGATKDNPKPKDPFWKERVDWGWKFKGDDAWLTVTFKDSKFLKEGEVRWLPKKKVYELTATPIEGKEKLVFEGEFKDDKLTFARTDAKSKEVQVFRMWVAGEIRLNYRVEKKASPRATIARLEYKFDATKDGESFGKKEKAPECVVSGGRGTSTVSYMGETFYICCSGCADAFKENPKKYVDEFKKNKKK